ncbi:hypothetical protein GCM10027615_34940 [Plantactinospora veratri]
MQPGAGGVGLGPAPYRRLHPRTNLPTLEADLYDGSDIVTLVWLGRRHISGIEPGRQLTARGRMAVRDDRKVIYNPYYELESPR